MISLRLPAAIEASQPYVGRVESGPPGSGSALQILEQTACSTLLASDYGLIAVDHPEGEKLQGDVLLVDPVRCQVERLIRSESVHNTFLVTEQCDQLCVMCSQPPKKTHEDRFALYEQACLLAPENVVLGFSGGEPTLYKEQLFGLIERVGRERPDLGFHILSNGQHFEEKDIPRLSQPAFRQVQWGIPIYSGDPMLHDNIVGKAGAFARLEHSLANLCLSGSSIELRTVVLQSNFDQLASLAQYIVRRVPFAATWSIMQLENIGFARNRWRELAVDHSKNFKVVGSALDIAHLFGMDARLFNFPRCTVPEPYRHLAVASISDWKQKFGAACSSCRERDVCSGFFEWHPQQEIDQRISPL